MDVDDLAEAVTSSVSADDLAVSVGKLLAAGDASMSDGDELDAARRDYGVFVPRTKAEEFSRAAEAQEEGEEEKAPEPGPAPKPQPARRPALTARARALGQRNRMALARKGIKLNTDAEMEGTAGGGVRIRF